MCKDSPAHPMATPPRRSWDLRITLDRRDTYAILTLEGRVSRRTSARLREAMDACKGLETLLIDLAGVDYVSSGGLGALSKASAALRLVLCVPPGPVLITLELAGLPDSIRLEPSLTAALGGLADEPAPTDN